MNDLLAIVACPLCGHTQSRPETAVIVVEDYRYERWIRAAAEAQGRSLPAERPTLKICERCETRFFAHWPSPTLQARAIYEGHEPAHPTGMSVAREKGGFLAPSRTAVARFLRGHIGRIESYGEFGCPSWGLIGEFSRPRIDLFWGLAAADSEASVLGRELGKLATARGGVGGLARRLFGLGRERETKSVYFIPANGRVPSFWGAACRFTNGISCVDMITARYGATVLPLGQAPAHVPLDIVSAINVLDHHPKAYELLDGFAEIARHLFIYAHMYDPRHLGLHHLFYPSETTFTRLTETGWRLIASHETGGPNRGFLLRNERF